MKEQEIGSKDILQAISDLTEISGKVKGESIEMRNGSQEIITESTSLERITEDVKKHVDSMAENVDTISGTIGHVESMIQDNQNSIDLLHDEIKQFKVG
jgi:methyl-accepting chemotaxis protein